MKKSAALIIVGGIFALIGLIAAISSANLSPVASEFEIPSGSDYYNMKDVYVPPGGELKVDFRVTDGTVVDFYVLTQEQYDGYRYGGEDSNVASTSGSSGVVSVKFPQGCTCYLVFDHGSGYDGTVQKGTVNHKVNGVNVPVMAGGFVILVLGLVLASYGGILRKKEIVPQPEWVKQQSTGVVYFKDQRPPAQPPKT